MIEGALASVGDIQDPQITSGLLDSCFRRAVSLWPRWLKALGPAVLADSRFDTQLAKARGICGRKQIRLTSALRTRTWRALLRRCCGWWTAGR